MKNNKKLLITGAAGFIGSEFTRQAVQKGYAVIAIDKLTYAGDLKRLEQVKKKLRFYRLDVIDRKGLKSVIMKEKPACIIHFAAETHVDRSIQDAHPFIKTNIIGTQNLIDIARASSIKKFIHISTDEVYGESKTGWFRENSPLKPNNPYSATKAAAELLIKAAIRTHGLKAIIIRPCNNYGSWQNSEKFIPVIILKAIKGKKVPVYGKGRQIREWLHVSDCAQAIHTIIRKGKIGETYNIGSPFEQNNLKIAQMIIALLSKKDSLVQFVPDRPGHDFRYGLDSSKLKNLNWKPKIDLPKGLIQTIQWYKNHLNWGIL